MYDPNYGDVWTWVAIDAETKLVPTWHVGDRSIEDCYMFLSDLRSRIRIGNRIQLTTDGLSCYPPVVDALWRNGIDYGVVVKEYRTEEGENGRTSASATAIPIPAIPIVALLRTTHSTLPNPAPTGSSPKSEPTTHDTLISK